MVGKYTIPMNDIAATVLCRFYPKLRMRPFARAFKRVDNLAIL